MAKGHEGKLSWLVFLGPSDLLTSFFLAVLPKSVSRPDKLTREYLTRIPMICRIARHYLALLVNDNFYDCGLHIFEGAVPEVAPEEVASKP